MKQVMVFEKNDGLQLVKDYQQMMAHITEPLCQDDVQMLERVEQVQPMKAVVLSEGQAHYIYSLLSLMQETVDDPESLADINDALSYLK